MMTQEKFVERKLFSNLVIKRMLLIGSIALIMVSVFVIGAGQGDPAWGRNWRIKPLLLTPLFGAAVGLLYDITEPLRKIHGWAGKAFIVLSIIGVLVGLWIGLVLGLNGTMWD